jgi:hypothetical protein
MKLGIMQPYFFPYLGYFDLINYTDQWIVFDTAQYIRHGWVNRNRILHPNEGWMYITVPVKQHTQDMAIKDIEIADSQNWKRSILGKLAHYKNQAPYADETVDLVKDYSSFQGDSLARLNAYVLDKVCRRLGIDFEYSFFSEMELDLESIEDPGDWALRISEAMGAEEYANPPGGVDLFDEQAFADSGIKLTIRNLPTFQYTCGDYDFIPNLSIIDVLMWNEPEEIKAYLDEHTEI